MSGIIEVIEAAGQRSMCAKSILPRYLNEASRIDSESRLASLGIAVSLPVDDLFYGVTLPDGWRVERYEHSSYWSDLLDSDGTRRARIFYKAAPYDRRASIYFDAEPGASQVWADGTER